MGETGGGWHTTGRTVRKLIFLWLRVEAKCAMALMALFTLWCILTFRRLECVRDERCHFEGRRWRGGGRAMSVESHILFHDAAGCDGLPHRRQQHQLTVTTLVCLLAENRFNTQYFVLKSMYTSFSPLSFVSFKSLVSPTPLACLLCVYAFWFTSSFGDSVLRVRMVSLF